MVTALPAPYHHYHQRKRHLTIIIDYFQLSLSPSISSLSSSTLFNYHYHVTSIIFIIIIPQALTFVSSHGIRARPLWLHQDGDGRSNKRKGSTLDDWQPGADKSKERI